MTAQVLEGTWEEVARRAKDLAGRKVRLLILDSDAPAKPNKKALAVIKKIRQKQKGTRLTSGETGTDIVKRARSGEMFENDSK